MQIRTIGRRLAVALALATAALATTSGRASATSSLTFSPYLAHYPGPAWIVAAENASAWESHQLVKHWRKAHTAFWDAGGVPVFIGTPKQLDRLGQRPYELALQEVCAYGTHQYTPKHPINEYGFKSTSRIVILTAGSWSCIDHGKYHSLPTKVLETTLIHEVLEYLVDPEDPVRFVRVNHHNAEVCDPVNKRYRYDKHLGAWLTDFVYPSYFKDSSSPYDFFHELSKGI